MTNEETTEFFRVHSEKHLTAHSHDINWDFTVEDLYQAFKMRLTKEMVSETESAFMEAIDALKYF